MKVPRDDQQCECCAQTTEPVTSAEARMIWWPFSQLNRVRDARMDTKTKDEKVIAQSLKSDILDCTEKELQEKLK